VGSGWAATSAAGEALGDDVDHWVRMLSTLAQ
jgi:hypothetical protein